MKRNYPEGLHIEVTYSPAREIFTAEALVGDSALISVCGASLSTALVDLGLEIGRVYE